MKRSDLLVLPAFFILAIAYLWPVTLGGRTLVPADNLFAFPPWSAFASQNGVGVPHNELLSDLVLENYAWKQFIVDTVRQGELPLWNPYLFTGVPFLAAGQQSALYPFFLLFFAMPVEAAFGWFVAIQLGIAGAAMYLFARSHRMGAAPAAIGALTYQFSAFFLVSVVFPMVISAACWLPLLLLCVEKVVAAQARRARGGVVAGWIAVGALVLAVSYLAGHIEVSYYNLLVMAFYGVWRMLASDANSGARGARAAWLMRAGLPLAALVALGTALAAVQIVPLFELVSHSARQGSQPYETIAGYAYPVRQIATLFIPDFFGNPSHHGFVDWWTRSATALTTDAEGRPADTVFWGIKNYVEAGSYVGLLPLLLALIAIAARFRRRVNVPYMGAVLPFAVLAVLSLAFVFGTPLYAVLFYGLPGFSQLHSPFRWVFPYTLSVAFLAGAGAQWLADRQPAHRMWGRLPLVGGVFVLIVLGISQVMPGPFLLLAERILRGSDLARQAFPDARAFFSYEALNILKFALLLAASGAVVGLARRAARGWPLAAVALVVADLFIAGNGFYTAADPALLKFTPPAVQFLQQDKSLFRIATLDEPGEKVFNANVGMFYGMQDIRGYDSIIPRQYYDWINLVETQGELIYNRIAPFYWRGSLDSALLDLANVKYVLTTQDLSEMPKFTRVYTGEVSIYRNEHVMPRAFVIPGDKAVRLQSLDQLRSIDPRNALLLSSDGDKLPGATSACASPETPVIRKYAAAEVVIDVASACGPAWLVLSDAYSDGWQAFTTGRDGLEVETTITLADGNFRAIYLENASATRSVRFRYNPLSFRLGLALSFFALMALLLMGGYALWSRRERPASVALDRSASRVLKNSAFPMMAQLLNKGIDTVFTLYMLRVLGVENAGKLATATLIIGYCDIVVNFGLSTLVTRDVSRERGLANRYLSNTGFMRFILIAALVPVLAAYLWASGQSADTALAIWLLFIGLVPSSLSASLSAIFYASEQMEYPAVVTVITTLMKVTVGTLVLLAGLGFVGLAGANIATNVATLAILLAIFARRQFVPRPEFSAQFAGGLVRTSYPLMLNDMLSRLFNRVDVLILQQMKGNVPVGWYSTTYKFLEGINILPSTFTIALFPVLSRYAAGAPDALMKAYLKSLKYLLVIAMPIMVFSFAWADFIMFVFGGQKFLPDSAIALRLIIGFLPFSFINNITHYVLIAVNQQKFLTWTFVFGALFNISANLLLIPAFSYQASAVITIGSELVLLALFYWGVRAHVGHVDWLDVLWRPALGAAAMGAVVALWDRLWGLGGWSFLGTIPLALAAYVGVLLAARTFSAEDRDTLRLLIPARFRRGGART